MSALDVKTEREWTIGFDGQPRRQCVRIFYRRAGTKRWSKRLVFPGDGMTLEMVEARAQEIAADLLAGKVESRAAPSPSGKERG